jgi:hypothetical protein
MDTQITDSVIALAREFGAERVFYGAAHVLDCGAFWTFRDGRFNFERFRIDTVDGHRSGRPFKTSESKSWSGELIDPENLPDAIEGLIDGRVQSGAADITAGSVEYLLPTARLRGAAAKKEDAEDLQSYVKERANQRRFIKRKFAELVTAFNKKVASGELRRRLVEEDRGPAKAQGEEEGGMRRIRRGLGITTPSEASTSRVP